MDVDVDLDSTSARHGTTDLRVVCISDTHNQHASLDIPPGDVLLHVGDCTNHGTLREVSDFAASMSFGTCVTCVCDLDTSMDATSMAQYPS